MRLQNVHPSYPHLWIQQMRVYLRSVADFSNLMENQSCQVGHFDPAKSGILWVAIRDHFRALVSTIQAWPHNVIILHRQYILVKGVSNILANHFLQQIVVLLIYHLNRP
jgi:hypothetical protein